MGLRTTLAFLVALCVVVSSPPASSPSAVALSPARTELQEGEPKAASAPEAALSTEDREALALLRSVLADEGRESAREILRDVVAGLAEPQAGPEAASLAFLLELDRVAQELGSLEESRRLRESVLAIWSRLLPSDHPILVAAKLNLAVTRRALGDLAGARELSEAVLEARTRLLPADHPDLLLAKLNVAVARKELGDLAGAQELEEAVLEAWTRLLPPDHPNLLMAMQNLAVTRFVLGDLAGAQELSEAVLEARTRLLPPDHPDLLDAKLNLAGTRYTLGEVQGAQELFEAVLEARTRLHPSDHPDLLKAKQNLALTRAALGDLAGAQELAEALLEARTRLLPADHPDLLAAKLTLAIMRKELGDPAGAKELEEAVLEVWTRLLPPDHPDLLKAKGNLASTLSALGDRAGAKELQEAVLEARTGLLPPDHPDLLKAKQGLAMTRHDLGDLAGAKVLKEAVLEALERFLPSDHPDLLAAKQSLAATRAELGDFAGAHEIFEAVLEARTRLLPPDHPDLLTAKQNLALTRAALGDPAGARELVSSMLAGVRLRAGALRAEAARPAREGAQAELERLSMALFSSFSVDPEHALEPELFATLESLRLASVASAEAAHALGSDPELARESRGIAEICARLNDLVAAGPEDAASAEGWRGELLRLAEERDRAQRGLRRRLAEAGAFVGELDAPGLGRRLAGATAAVSFLRYTKRFERDRETGDRPPSVDALLAFVVKSGGAVARVELGPAAELETLVQDWRRALGKPIERGIATQDDPERSEENCGRALRARILDPLLAAAGEEVRALHVVLDDVLFLVPLDALPLEEGERVGERLRIHVEPTLARLLREERPLAPGGTLVALGGIDFDAESQAVAASSGEAPAEEPVPLPAALLASATPPLERSGRPDRFEALLQTRFEVEGVAVQYREALGGEPVHLFGASATKSALFAAAPKARFLHLATHGWFASEAFKSQLDSLTEASAHDAFQRAEQMVTGFAPETLCGLALAGANRGKDALGRVPGILTAEELASFDLRNCELAVLSACETNVGIRRAGQGIQSLQTALHAAGARTAITSLWKVDDAATRRLFELFYTKLWRSKLGKHEALWQAKMALRAEGHPLRDWAGWILSGDLD